MQVPMTILVMILAGIQATMATAVKLTLETP